MTSSARSKHSSSIALMMFLTASRPETSSSIAEFAITVSVKAAVVAKDSWSFASLDAPEMAMAPHSTSNPKSKRSSSITFMLFFAASSPETSSSIAEFAITLSVKAMPALQTASTIG